MLWDRHTRPHQGENIRLIQSMLNYLLSPNEVWARAYAQWLALRSQNSDLLKGIADARRLGAADPYAGRQWEDADFEPIAKEIDAIFKKLGWRK